MEIEYIDLIKKFKTLKGKYRDQSYVAFHSMKGNQYDNRIMFVGRALNGWKWSFKLAEYESEDLNKFYQKIQSNGIAGDIENQLNWVIELWKANTKYKTSRSAFWRTIKKVVIGTNIGNKDNWNQKIVWSNLYKISNTNGNPRKSLMKLTMNENKKLLESEIKIYNPKIIVFLTGLKWLKGIFKDTELIEENNNNYIEYSGDLNLENRQYRIIVTPHPQGKHEKALACDIIKAVKKSFP